MVISWYEESAPPNDRSPSIAVRVPESFCVSRVTFPYPIWLPRALDHQQRLKSCALAASRERCQEPKGYSMLCSAITKFLVSVAILITAVSAHATTLRVNCGGRDGLTSINAALKVVQRSGGSGPNTISVSGNCRENVLIQSMDRLTLTAVNGATISDASGGKLTVVDIEDSRDVAIKGFTINAGITANPEEPVYGAICGSWSSCRLSANVIQGAVGDGGAGLAVFGQSQATLEDDILQNNGVGLFLRSGSKVTTQLAGHPFISRGNGVGISIGRQGFAFINATVENNSDTGVQVLFQSTLQLSGSISGNGGAGADVSEGSVVRFGGATISNNGGAGVVVRDLSMVTFNGASVTGNGGGIDVVCEPQLPVTRHTADIEGTTNCVEP